MCFKLFNRSSSSALSIHPKLFLIAAEVLLNFDHAQRTNLISLDYHEEHHSSKSIVNIGYLTHGPTGVNEQCANFSTLNFFFCPYFSYFVAFILLLEVMMAAFGLGNYQANVMITIYVKEREEGLLSMCVSVRA